MLILINKKSQNIKCKIKFLKISYKNDLYSFLVDLMYCLLLDFKINRDIIYSK